MKLMCIKKGGYHLTVGKIYNAVICDDSASDFFPGRQVFDYSIINDNGIRHGIESDLFVDIVKVRQDKLNELGI